ncbi:MAG: sulfatase-like hydrolase/transferase [Planctomycetota bacterium]
MVPLGDELSTAPATGRNGRPNILMLFSDEHHWQYSGYAGHPVVQTPNLDRLAASGVNFTDAYCNSPLCSPSRQSFMAGLYCHRIGMWNNVCSMPENTVTWAHALHAAGYETLLCGKMHFNGYQKMYGFNRRPVLEGGNSGAVFHSWGYRTSHSWLDPLPYRADPGYPGNRDIDEAGADTPERRPIFRHDTRIADGTLAVLREKAADPAGKPWALCCGMVLPHPPFTARPDLMERYRGKGDLPFNLEGASLGVCDRYIRQYSNLDRTTCAPDRARILREAYFGLITEYDEYVGRIMDCLRETGLAGNTVVFYFSDHGEMACEHGMIGKVPLRESSVRVPLLVSWPGRFAAGRTVNTPVSLVDLYPTFLDIARYRLPAQLPLDGNSLMPLIEGRPAEFKGCGVFGEFEGEGWNHPRAFVREGDFKFVYSHTAPAELYHVRDDYFEMSNLVGMPAYAAVEARLRARLLDGWDPAAIEIEVIRTQERQKLAPCRNVCGDLGW